MFVALIPFAALGLLAYAFRRRRGGWREAILSAGVAWGVALTAITEGLSAAHRLTHGWVLTAWLVFAAVVVLVSVSRAGSIDRPPVGIVAIRRWWPALAGLLLIVLAVGLIAVIAPPNNTDSLTYHMPRVAHWIQNGSVASYATHTLRQLHLAPWAEFAILQPQILSGGDRWANLVQWLAMLGSLVGVSLIARQLGGDLRCQILAAIFCATLPMGILQASGAQNDYVVSFWIVCFVRYMLAFMGREEGREPATTAWPMGASLGLAILTKATAYPLALPFGVWLILHGRRRPERHVWRTVGIVALAVFLLNAGHYWRNTQMFGLPLGPGGEGAFTYANETFTVPAVVSNAVRNLALHVGTPSEDVNGLLESGVLAIHRYVGADVNDPRTTWRGQVFHVTGPETDEDQDGNPLHLALIAMSCAMLALLGALRRRRVLIVYAGALVAAFLLFVLSLKWQPWHSRLHLPMFVLWSPLVGVVWGRYRRVTGVVVAALLLMALPWVVNSDSKPLIGAHSVLVRSRLQQYFSRQQDLTEPYAAVMRQLEAVGCTDIGLWLHELPEYSLWVFVGQEGGRGRGRLEDIHVGNASKPFPSRRTNAADPDPCAILVKVVEAPVPPVIYLNTSTYLLMSQEGPVSVFLRERMRSGGE